MAKSKKDVPAIVSALGVLMSIISTLVALVLRRGGTAEDIYRLATPEGKGLLEKFADLIVGAKQATGKVFQIVCDGSYTASELIKLGVYTWFNNWITDQRFPLGKHQPATRQIEFVELGYDPSSEDVLREFERRGLERPTAEDALYFGIQHKDEQRKGPIVFLHEPVLVPDSFRGVLVLDGGAGRRYLGLSLFGSRSRWSRYYRFAGVRESS